MSEPGPIEPSPGAPQRLPAGSEPPAAPSESSPAPRSETAALAGPRTSRRGFLSGQAATEAARHWVARWDAAGRRSYSQSAPPQSPSSAEGRSAEYRALPDAAAEGYLVHFSREAMACRFELSLNAGQYPEGAQAALEALDVIDQLEDQLTIYRPGSEVSQINRLAAQQPQPVEPRLFALLAQCRELGEATGGAFDITSGVLSRLWGFTRRQGTLPTDEELADALQCVGSDKFTLNSPDRSIRLLKPGVELNLGSIGKGYALDRAAEHLRRQGVADFLWQGGQSSILARGHRGELPDGGWIVGLEDPVRPGRRLAEIRLRDRALGTSGSAVQFFRHNGKRYGHILDPRTGRPAEGVYSATVLAPTAAEADALATACYVLGEERAAELAASRPEMGLLLMAVDPKTGATRLRCEGVDPDVLTLLQ